MERVEILEFLKEILRVCGNSIVVQMAFLKKIQKTSSSSNGQYQLVIKANLGGPELKCIEATANKFGIAMNNTGDLWFFFKREHLHKDLLSK